MRVRGVVVSLTVVFAAVALGGGAEAGEQRKWRRVEAPPDNYYAGPGFVHRVPGLRVLFGDYALSPEEYDRLYGEGTNFDESYYEPQPLVKAKPKPKPVEKAAKAPPPPKAPSADTTASVGKPAATGSAVKKPAAKAAAVATAKPAPIADVDEAPIQSGTSSVSASQPKSTAGMSCEKATSIVAGYGFSAVKPDSCSGKIYAFNATRDGRTFAIKFDAGNGELTEVKKLN